MCFYWLRDVPFSSFTEQESKHGCPNAIRFPNKTFSSEIGPDVVLDRSKSGDCETPRNSVSFTALFGESGNVCWYADDLAHLLTLSLSLPGRSVLDGRESSPHT